MVFKIPANRTAVTPAATMGLCQYIARLGHGEARIAKGTPEWTPRIMEDGNGECEGSFTGAYVFFVVIGGGLPGEKMTECEKLSRDQRDKADQTPHVVSRYCANHITGV